MIDEKYPIKQVAIVEIMGVAVALHEYYSKYLIAPPGGVYLRNSFKPVLVPNQKYYQRVITDTSSGNQLVTMVPINFDDPLTEVQGAVFDENGVLLVSAHAIHMLRPEPLMPVVATELILDLLNLELNKLQAWVPHGVDRKLESKNSAYEVIMRYLTPEAKDAIANDNIPKTGPMRRDIATNVELLEELVRNQPVLVDLFEDILRHMAVLRKRIVSFVGEDVWCVHFMEHLAHGAISLSKSVDYRIIDWHEKNGVPIDY